MTPSRDPDRGVTASGCPGEGRPGAREDKGGKCEALGPALDVTSHAAQDPTPQVTDALRNARSAGAH
jgi:hypothetical protein